MDKNLTIQESELVEKNVITETAVKKTAVVLHTTTQQEFFYKKLSFDETEAEEAKVVKEMCISLTLKDDHLVKHHQVIEGNGYMIFLADYHPQGSLEKDINSRIAQKNPWSDEALWSIFQYLIKGFKYMRSELCAHRNIQPKNLIKISSFKYKITNFNCCLDLVNAPDVKSEGYPSRTISLRQSITIKKNDCLSPETRRYLQNIDVDTYDAFKADVYALGLVFLRISSLKTIEYLNDNAFYETVSQSISKLIRPKKIKDLITDMLIPESIKRPEFSQLELKFFPKIEPLKSSFQIRVDEVSNLLDTDKIANNSTNVKKKSLRIRTNSMKSFTGRKITKQNLGQKIFSPEIKINTELKPLDEEEKKLAPLIKNVSQTPMKKCNFNLNLKSKLIVSSKQIISKLEDITIKCPEIHISQNKGWPTKIFKCIINSSGEQAIAKCYTSSPKMFERADFEKYLYQKLSPNPAFLKYFGSFTSGSSLYIIIEYAPLNLRSYITNPDEVFDEPTCKTFICELLQGFEELEKLKVCHCDIKPDNILITHDNHPKIIDFGSARQYIEGQDTNVIVGGTNNYLAPEIVEDGSKLDKRHLRCDYNMPRADAYSLGITLLEMVLKIETNMYNLPHNQSMLKRRVNSIMWGWARDLVELLVFDRISMKEAYLNTSSINSSSYSTRR